MKNRIDDLIERLNDVIQTGDGSPDSQDRINAALLLAIQEINSILKTCERDLR